MTEITDEQHSELIARAEAVASKGIQRDDGYAYSVPASALIESQDIIRELVATLRSNKKRDIRPSAGSVERVARAMFEVGGIEEGDWAWADVVRDEPSRAELWRNDARQVATAFMNGAEQ